MRNVSFTLIVTHMARMATLPVAMVTQHHHITLYHDDFEASALTHL